MQTETQKGGKFRNQLFRLIRWDDLDKAYLRQLICLAREEDLEGSGLMALPVSPGDPTANIFGSEKVVEAQIAAREDLFLCGLPMVPLVLETYGAGTRFIPFLEEGVPVKSGEALGLVKAPHSVLLKAERVLLNFLQHLSGIATQTARYVEALNWSPTKLLDTRKTTPGLRVLEKYAVAQGGGWNHRTGLFDRIFIEANHLHLPGKGEASAAAPAKAVEKARSRNQRLAIEVEITRLDQIPSLLEAEADVLCLRDFSLEDLTEAVMLIGDRAFTRATGQICFATLPKLAAIGLDFISCEALTEQSVWKKIELVWSPNP